MDEILSTNQETALACTPSKEDCAIVEVKKEETALTTTTKAKVKNPKKLAIASLVLALVSVPCALVGLVPLQIFLLALSLIFYMVDRNLNGKRGLSLFSMICTIITFVIIFITLTYCIILFSFGMYTAFINPEPYNFIMDTVKSIISFIAGIFGITTNFWGVLWVKATR